MSKKTQNQQASKEMGENKKRRQVQLNQEGTLDDQHSLLVDSFQRATNASFPTLRPNDILTLQRGVGNRAVQRLLEDRERHRTLTNDNCRANVHTDGQSAPLDIQRKHTAETSQAPVTLIDRSKLISNTEGQRKRKPEVFLSEEQIISRQESPAISGSQKDIRDFSFSFTYETHLVHIPFDDALSMNLHTRFEENNLDIIQLWSLFKRILDNYLKPSIEEIDPKDGVTYKYSIKADVNSPKTGKISVKLVDPKELIITEKSAAEVEPETEEQEETPGKITCEITECSRTTKVPFILKIQGEATNANWGNVDCYLAQTDVACGLGAKGMTDSETVGVALIKTKVMPNSPFGNSGWFRAEEPIVSSRQLGPKSRIVVRVTKEGQEPGYCCAKAEPIW